MTSPSESGRPPPLEAPSRALVEGRWSSYLLWLGVIAGVAARAWVAAHDQGIYWPDEIYQSLEPAHRLVFGYGMVAWEFIEGARSWAFPGLVAGLLAVARALGLVHPEGYLGFVRAFLVLGAGATGLGVHRLARVYGAPRLAAAAGALAFLWAAPSVYFGHRAMSETVSALPVVFGFALGLDANASRRARALGALLLGVSVLLRLQNGLFCVALLLILFFRRERRVALEALGVLALCALFFGLLDALTWGQWFHSAIVYLRFNLIEGKGAAWGTDPFGYFAQVLFRCMPLLTVLLLLQAAAGARKALGLFLACLAFFLVHSYVPHKELRFLFPMLPLWCALAAVGLGVTLERVDARACALGACLLVIASAQSLAHAPKLTFGELGAYETLKPQASAWDDFGDVNRLLLRAHQAEDLCGLKVEAAHLAWAGGQTYLHRDVPLYSSFGPPRGSGYFNYVITDARDRAGEKVAQEGRVALVRLGRTCTPDDQYSWRLP